MRNLKVFIEIRGEQIPVGEIVGEDYRDARFRYYESYINSSYARPISISIPLMKDYYKVEATRNFFEGLLPEGFSRKAVADWIKTDEHDYVSILSVLGRECLGAIKIIELEESDNPAYEELALDRVKALAEEGATKSTQILMETHLSLTGATGKVGLYFDKDKEKWYLPKGSAPSTHIVKQSHVRLKKIVLNEQMCVLTARKLGINVPHSFIINIGNGEDESVLFATERYDRKLDGNKSIDGHLCPLRLHQEDFSQALGIMAADKYEKEPRGYMIKMFDLIRNYSSIPLEDQKELLKIICFNYLIGNTDCHIKNFSLLYDENLSSLRLAPAYDLVSTRVYKMTSDMSFYIGGELDISKISRESFAVASSEVGIGKKLVLQVFDELANGFEAAIGSASEELMEQGFDGTDEMRDSIINCGGFRRC